MTHTEPAAIPTLRAFIGLGANLGDTHASLRQATQELAGTPGIMLLRVSPLYRSAPVESSGPDYLNAVAEVATTLGARALLGVLQGIEQTHGRERPYRNAPRTLDLDLLLYGDQHIDEPDLQVPHPRMHERAFVLRPLADLTPALTLAQGPLQALIESCAGQALWRVDGCR